MTLTIRLLSQQISSLISRQKAVPLSFYAVWKPYKVAFCYHANGGIISEDSDFYLDDSSNILKKSDNSANLNNWDIDSRSQYGLYNASSFKLSRPGYRFAGWCMSPDGSTTIYDQDDGTVTAEMFFPNIRKKNGSVMFYAV